MDICQDKGIVCLFFGDFSVVLLDFVLFLTKGKILFIEIFFLFKNFQIMLNSKQIFLADVCPFVLSRFSNKINSAQARKRISIIL